MFRRKKDKEVQLIRITQRGTQYGDPPPKASNETKPVEGSKVIWTKKPRSLDDNVDTSKYAASISDRVQNDRQPSHQSDGAVSKRDAKQRPISRRLSKSLEDNLDKVDSSSEQVKKKYGSHSNDLDKPNMAEPAKSSTISRKKMKISPSPSTSPSHSNGPASKMMIKGSSHTDNSQAGSSAMVVFKDGKAKPVVSSCTTVQVQRGSPSPSPNAKTQTVTQSVDPDIKYDNKSSQANKLKSPSNSPAESERSRVHSYTQNVQIIPLMQPKKKVSSDKENSMDGTNKDGTKLPTPSEPARQVPLPPHVYSRNLQIIPLMEPKRRISHQEGDKTSVENRSSSSKAVARKEYRHSSGAILDGWISSESSDPDHMEYTKSLKQRHQPKVHVVHKTLVETKADPFKATKVLSHDSFRDRTDTTESMTFNVSFDL